MTEQTYLEWRGWVGPHYMHWDWSGINLGDTTTIPAATTLATTMSNVSTTAVLASGTGYPTGGAGAFIGPNGVAQAWEYVRYASRSGNTLSGLVREVGGGHSGAHTSGALARI